MDSWYGWLSGCQLPENRTLMQYACWWMCGAAAGDVYRFSSFGDYMVLLSLMNVVVIYSDEGGRKGVSWSGGGGGMQWLDVL